MNPMSPTSPVSPASPASSVSSERLVHTLRPKGHAIQGVDYGLDMLDAGGPNGEPQGGAGSVNGSHNGHQVPPSPSIGQQSNHSYNQQGPYSPPPPPHQQQHQQHQQHQQQHHPHGQPQEPQYSQPMEQMSGFGTESEILSNRDSFVPGAGFVDSSFMGGMAPEMSYEEKRRRKTDALARLARLEQQGYQPAGKKGSHTTELNELEAMVEKLTAQRDLDSSIKFQRKILIGFATLAESVCEHDEYNIFELDLQGWSESLYENITDYDEVFEELYLKYKDVAHIPPEVKLISMVVGSAWMYHMSRNMFGKAASKVPGFDDVMSFDPDLKKHYQQTATNLAQQRGFPVPDKKKDKNGFNFLGQLFGGGGGSAPAPMPNPGSQRSPQPPRQPQQPHYSSMRPQPMQRPPPVPMPRPAASKRRVPMEEPQDVDNLLGSLSPGVEEELDLSEMEAISDLA